MAWCSRGKGAPAAAAAGNGLQWNLLTHSSSSISKVRTTEPVSRQQQQEEEETAVGVLHVLLLLLLQLQEAPLGSQV
jgi:hypothetical protein